MPGKPDKKTYCNFFGSYDQEGNKIEWWEPPVYMKKSPDDGL